jgi:hypothetical protein
MTQGLLTLCHQFGIMILLDYERVFPLFGSNGPASNLVVLTFDLFAGREESLKEKNPGTYVARLASTGFFSCISGVSWFKFFS